MNDTCCLITCVNSSSLVILPIQRSTVKVVNFLTKDENLCSSLKRASSARRKRRPIGRRHHNDDDNDDYEENISKRDKRVGDGRMRVEVQSKTLEPQIWCFHNNEPRFGSGWLRYNPCTQPPANEHQKERSWWRPYNTRERLSQARPMNSEFQGTDGGSRGPDTGKPNSSNSKQAQPMPIIIVIAFSTTASITTERWVTESKSKMSKSKTIRNGAIDLGCWSHFSHHRPCRHRHRHRPVW